jgi:hypothetical protein
MSVSRSVRTARLLATAALLTACAGNGGSTFARASASTSASVGERSYAPAITEADLRTRLFIFADDSMEGRGAGSPGHERALRYIVRELERLGVSPRGDDGYLQRVPIARYGSASSDTIWSHNVVAVIEGSDPVLREEFVALGAHSDHVGIARRAVDHDSVRAFNQATWEATGRDPNSRGPTPAQRAAVRVNVDSLRAVRPPRADSIFNGADDDGSGSMALLEIAEAFATARVKPKRSILLVWHTGEEIGLNGSEWFMDHPTVERSRIVAQVNLDMIGRGMARDVAGGGPDHLTVLGPRRLSSEFDTWVRDVNARQPQPFALDYAFDADGHPQQFYCRSDHYHYARYGIPIAFFFTSVHEDYHQVTDEPQYIEYAKYTRVTRYLHDLAAFVADQPIAPVVDQPRPDPTGRCRQ